MHFVGVQKVVLPEPLASPAAALEGPISLAEIEPRNLKTDVALLDSQPQVIEAVPPREPDPAPSLPAVTPSPESVQGSGNRGSATVPLATTVAATGLSDEVKASSVSETPERPLAQTQVAELVSPPSPLQLAAVADPTPVSNERTTVCLRHSGVGSC